VNKGDSKLQLYQQCIDTIVQLQQHQGYFLSSSNFASPCYIRDCSFASHALDLDNQRDKSRKFLQWALDVLRENTFKMQLTMDRIGLGLAISEQDYIPCKFEQNGEAEVCSSTQIEGWAAFLWALAKHCKIYGDTSLIEENRQQLNLLYNYLSVLWQYPSCSCWEQDNDKIHISNVIAVYGGLSCIKPYIKVKGKEQLSEIKKYVIDNGIYKNHLARWRGSSQTEAILLWALYPYGIFDKDMDLEKTVVSKIVKELHNSGLYRFKNDNYYGGGVWPLLNCFLGLGYLALGDNYNAREQYELVSRLLNKGVPCELQPSNPNSQEYSIWVKNFGKPAQNHLWTAAMYIIFTKEMEGK
jgi:isomaltose glucohydrolase